MMGITDRDVETLLRDATFPNPTHKDALRERLLDSKKLLSMDDLAFVSGGNGGAFLGNDREVAVCDSCKVYSSNFLLTGDTCSRCGRKFSRIIAQKDLPAGYDMLLQ